VKGRETKRKWELQAAKHWVIAEVRLCHCHLVPLRRREEEEEDDDKKQVSELLAGAHV